MASGMETEILQLALDVAAGMHQQTAIQAITELARWLTIPL